MKNKIETPARRFSTGLRTAVCLAVGSLLAFAALAQNILPSWKTQTAIGTSSAPILFAQTPNSQIRLTCCIESSDLAGGTLSVYTGGTATYCTNANTNTTGVTNIQVASTNNILVGDLMYIQLPGTNWVTNNTSVSAGNIGFGAAFPTNIPANCEVEDLGANPAIQFLVGITTNKIFSSDALFVGNYGRALYLALSGTSHTTNYASVHYDATSQ